MIKEKLISNKLMKMKSKMSKIAKLRMKREKGLNATTDLKGELSVVLSNISSEEKAVVPDVESKPDLTELEEFIAKKEDLIAIKIKKKKEAWQVSDSKTEVKNGVGKVESNKKETANGGKEIASEEKKPETKENIDKPSTSQKSKGKPRRHMKAWIYS